MRLPRFLWLGIGAAFGAALASGGVISYTCDPNVATATCTYLNTTVAGLYSSTFSNANASIYIQYGTTGLGSSTTGFYNLVTFSDYVAALTANPNMDTLQIDSLAALNSLAATPYGADDVNLTSALAQALNITTTVNNGANGIAGTDVLGNICYTPGSSGCYNGIITITNDPGTPLYYRTGGPEASDAYDYYTTVEHETDEVLGTSSCIDTTGNLTDTCDSTSGDTGTPAAIDLFRYNSAGQLAINSNYIGSTGAPAGAYFSYDGGASNGANGDAYNTLANGDDYADFVGTCPSNQHVQDAEGCPGFDAGIDITNDGGAEINLLNAVGYDLIPAGSTPEPGTMTLFGAGLASLAFAWRRRKA